MLSDVTHNHCYTETWSLKVKFLNRIEAFEMYWIDYIEYIIYILYIYIYIYVIYIDYISIDNIEKISKDLLDKIYIQWRGAPCQYIGSYWM